MIGELIRYGLAGGITTGVNLFLFYLLERTGLYYLIANFISYYIAIAINYFLNQKFVFGNQKSNQHKLMKFVLLRTGSLLLDSTIFYFFVDILKFNIFKSRIALTFIVIIFNYIFCKKLIFKKLEEK